jgi:alpha-galactosidase
LSTNNPSKVCGGSGAGLGQGTKEIIDFVGTLRPSKFTKEYGWLDPDFLMTLFFPTMDFTESRTEYSFWALWSALLLVSTDVRNLSEEKKKILMNKEVIAINQDSTFTSGDLISKSADGVQIWWRPLANGDKAVILYNDGTVAQSKFNISIHWVDIGWPAKSNVTVRDIWLQQDLGAFVGSYTASDNIGSGLVHARDVQFLRCKLKLSE